MDKCAKILIMSQIMLFSISSADSFRILKTELSKMRHDRIEPFPSQSSPTREICPAVYPANMDDYTRFTLIDSSANGYGMVSTVTRPIDVTADGKWVISYRQYAGSNVTHGQLGAATSADGVNWEVVYNVNHNGDPPWGGGGVGGCGSAQARYPSSIASEEYPYALWTEYTAGPPTCPEWPDYCSSYGGRPYYSFDENGWGGNSWLYPINSDPLYDCGKDLWYGSPGHGYDAENDEHHISVVYDDLTRIGSFLFTSEAVVDGYIVMGYEALIINPNHLGTDGYSSSAILSMNDNGHGLLGINGIFAGNEPQNGSCNPPASNITCNKTAMFKITDDYGQSWYGDHSAFDFYYIPDEVYDDILSHWPSVDVDQCTGEQFEITDFWSWFEFDMRVDMNGNPHIVMSMIAESDYYYHFLDGKTGFYHFTIDRNYIDNPGSVNTSTGWNWSYVPLPANDSFRWDRPDGYSYLYGTMAQISLDRENPDNVYIVANIANKGEMSLEFDSDQNGIIDNPCQDFDSPSELYPNWSEDIWIGTSSDNGSIWIGLFNVTQTPRDPNNTGPNNCSPEEQYVHTAHWSTDEEVYFMYQQPEWDYNEIGDPLGADHKNRIFAGFKNLYSPHYDCWMYQLGDVNLDGVINVLDIVKLVSHILGTNLLDGCGLELADVNGDGTIDILDIIALIWFPILPLDNSPS